MTAWWSDARIDATVTQEYIERELGSKKHVDTLHRVLAFGDGLTDDTYLDWILERSPRIFLILNQIGVPEKVFEVTDRSFADDDLPLSQDTLWELNLFGGKSETLDKKFYREQFNFLIQELEPGGHVDYGTWEVIPVESTTKRPGIANNNSQTSDKVLVHSTVYTRKKVATFSNNGIDEVHFIMHLKALTALQHPHLVTVWATYSQDEYNYILLTPSTETNLKVFLEEPPKSFKSLEKYERRNIFLAWTHCLTSAVAYLHDKGFTHGMLRPSTITVDHRNTVFINGYSALKALDVDEPNSPYSGELYDHAAPENWTRQPCLHESAPLKTVLPGGGRTSRRIPKPQPIDPSLTLPLPHTPTTQGSRTASKSASSGSSTNVRPRNALITTFAPPQRANSIFVSSSTSHRACASDIFSLTTVLLTVLSMILQHTPKSFASHRCRLNRQAGRGNAPPDSSFHKNLGQVTKWIDMLAKEAGQRERKDMKFWGSVVELVQVCRLGVKREAKDRISAKDLDNKVKGWVEFGLGRRRKCSCMTTEAPDQCNDGEGESVEEPTSKYSIVKKKQPSKPFTVKDRRRPTGKQGHATKRSMSEPSVSVGVGNVRPAGNSAIKESTVWGLGELSHLHSGMMRSASIASDKESTVWGLADEAPGHPPSKPPTQWSGMMRPASIASDKESTVWGLADELPGPPPSKPSQQRSGVMHPASVASEKESTVWGLPIEAPGPTPPPQRQMTSGNKGVIWGLRDVTLSDKRFTDNRGGGMHFPLPKGHADSRPGSVNTSCIAVGVPGVESEYSSQEESDETDDGDRREDWPLPLGSLRLDCRPT